MIDRPESPCRQPYHSRMLFFLFASFLVFSQLLFGSNAHKRSLFLQNITPLITWPQNNKPDFSICVLNDKNIFNALRSAYAGKSITKKPVHVSDLVHTDAASQCDILFIGKGADAVVELTQALSGNPVLTISEIKGFKDKGVMITILEDDDSTTCAINQKAAQQADIHISYLLLESAFELIK